MFGKLSMSTQKYKLLILPGSLTEMGEREEYQRSIPKMMTLKLSLKSRQSLRLHNAIILSCELLAFSLLLRVIYFLGIDNMAQSERG